MKIKNFKNKIGIVLAIILLVVNVSYPMLSLAQEAPSDTPTPTPEQSQTTVDNNSTVDNSNDNTSNTGDNTVNPTPTPEDPSITPTPTPDLGDQILDDLTATPSADESTPSAQDQSNNNSGHNSSGGNIDTGDATSVSSVENDVNETNINSKVVYQTINIFVDQDGNINLSDPFTIAASAIQSHPEDPVINLSVLNVNNYAYLSNDSVSVANTGDNTINGNKAIINTGNAYSVVSLLNNVNFTIVNSEVHVIVINLFGNLNGNIILPNLNTNTSNSCAGCGMSVDVNNNAQVENSTDSTANTGVNDVSGNGSITTGNATSAMNVFNLVGTTIIGQNAQVLYITNLGNWDGSFIGWDGFGAEDGGASLTFYSTVPGGGSGDCGCYSDINVNNTAIVLNNVSSLANTGGNNVNGNGSITTGNAYSAISLFNFVNTTFINSWAFFGFINIFGNWTGNIGGAKEFAGVNSQDDSNSNNQNVIADSAPQEEGGELSVSSSNNVGAFVYPGDTVTFTVKVKNTGSGKVYGTKVNLYLTSSTGDNAGGTSFDIGDINPGQTKTLSTGFVLSKKIPGGTYTAQAQAYGYVGPDNSEVDADSQNSFKVFGSPVIVSAAHAQAKANAVLGAKISINDKAGALKAAQELLYLSLLAIVILSYVSIRLIRRREIVYQIINSNSFKEALSSVRMFLL